MQNVTAYLSAVKEPKFIRDARRAVEQEAEGRPDAATYAEAGHAALNIVLAHYLATPLLNPGLVADEKLASQREHYERKLQQAADKLAGVEQERDYYLAAAGGAADSKTGLPYREALTRARDKLRSLENRVNTLEQIKETGISPKQQVVGRKYQHIRDENVRLSRRVIELEALLKQESAA